MPTELFAYQLLFLIGIGTILLENRYVLRYIYYPALFLFMLVVRLYAFVYSGYEADIHTYALEMKATSLDFYYLREFVFWLGIRVFYYFTESEFVTFILLDISWIYLLFCVSEHDKINNLGRGLVVVLATSFPFLFGYENIYRQFYASIVLLYAYSLVEVNYKKSIFILLITIFIHNVSLLLIPIFILKKFFNFNIKDRFVIASFVSVLYILMLGYMAQYKSAISTGIDVSMLYLLLFCAFFLMLIFSFKRNVLLFLEKMPSLFFTIIIMLGLLDIKFDIIAERMGMMFIIFLIYDLYKYSNSIENMVNRKLLRLFLLLIFTLPVFYFASSLKFLS